VSTLLSNGVSVASLVAVGLSVVLPLPPSAGGEIVGGSGSGSRGYAQLDRQSVATAVGEPHGVSVEDDVDGGGGGSGGVGLSAEVERLREECRQLRLSNARLEGRLGGDEAPPAAEGGLLLQAP
jgi:hypothetical protein